jgi:peptidoglycan/LPS O-acetylase OafA/YrhL
MDTLAAGALVAVVLRQSGAEQARRLGHACLGLGAGLVLVASAITLSRAGPGLLEPLDPVTQLLSYPGLALVFAGAIAILVTSLPSDRAPSALQSRFLLMLGRYSYAAYLIHVPLRNGAELLIARTGGLPLLGGTELPAQIVLTTVGIAVTLGLAAISWHLFEKRILTLKRYFAAEVAPVPALAAPLDDLPPAAGPIIAPSRR